jgi:GNAT superfamily N-acetyltransferase
MTQVSITIHRPETRRELVGFLRFADEVNAARSAHWPVVVPVQLPFLRGVGPSAHGRTVLPLLASDRGRPLARAVAIVDQAYLDHWGEPLGHVSLFEAHPDSVDATRALMDEACDWLKGHGLTAARAGLGEGPDFPFAIDDYESLPPMPVRQNPAYYHALLQESRFGTEKAYLDYVVEATPRNVARWEGMAASVNDKGIRIVPLGEVPEDRRLRDFTDTWNAAFASHWGMTPTTAEEFAEIFAFAGPLGMFELSVLAYLDDRPVGVVWTGPEVTRMARLAPGRELAPSERVSFFGLGVSADMRGHGLAPAMSAHSYLEQYRRGNTHMSYTMVLEDNWPSRRTAEKLGGRVRATYLVYRRDFR